MAGDQLNSSCEAMQKLVSKLDFPLLRENVWHIYPDADISFLETIDDLYEVETHSLPLHVKQFGCGNCRPQRR
jgi:hypothetical protein